MRVAPLASLFAIARLNGVVAFHQLLHHRCSSLPSRKLISDAIKFPFTLQLNGATSDNQIKAGQPADAIFNLEGQQEEFPVDEGVLNDASLRFRSESYDLSQAAVVGIMTGLSVAIFKLSIEAVRNFCYELPAISTFPLLRVAIPALGGLAVGLMMLLGAFTPGLRGTVKEVDVDSRGPMRNLGVRIKALTGFIRKSLAAVFTLGSGCSLGPEGPCVEIGMNVARTCMDIRPRRGIQPLNWNRLLLSCGAAAGVAAGFDAPIAGVFFALEIMQNAIVSVVEEENNGDNPTNGEGVQPFTAKITPVLLSSILSALVARTLLGNHLVLVLSEYSLKTPLVELPLYLLLGVVSGFIAFFFSQTAKFSQAFFSGEVGGNRLKGFLTSIPQPVKPIFGGLLCGLVGLSFPQILFFGYETLNSLLANASLPTSLLLSLLLVKTVMTAVSAGSGLVGGTFAPSLFLGAMTGASFHNIISALFTDISNMGFFGMFPGLVLELADVPAYAMVGAASVLAALFRAPLTASLLLFELTRDYDVILPLMASAGFGSVVSDILDDKFERARERKRQRRDQDPVSWGDLADQIEE